MLQTQAALLGNSRDVGTPLRAQTLVRLVGVAAVAAFAAILELAAARVLPVDAPRPHLALVVVAAVAVVGDLELTVVAALAGGAALDALAFRPLGITPFGLLLAGGVTAALASPFTGISRTVAVASVAPAAIVLGLWTALVSPQISAAEGVWRIAPGAALDLILACPLVLGGLVLRRRRAKEAAPSH